LKFTPQSIPEVLLIEPIIHRDERGYFLETFRQDELDQELGYKVNFIQDNESKSLTKGVIRGLHYQLPPFTQSKLVRVMKGRALDVAVDIRKNSDHFGKYVAVELSEENKKQLFVPKGFAHGFLTLSDEVIFTYKVDAYYSAIHEEGIAYNDLEIAIEWGFPTKNLILSKADQELSNLSDKNTLF
tara:strand:+ start:186 stop:740 length:555 start_codon:yes stop_codon:yes gene_type:complete